MNNSGGPYNSSLLNEIHTLFPALLYDGEQFGTVPQLMNYINQQMRRNFDVYSNNRYNYLNRMPYNISPLRRQQFNSAMARTPPQQQYNQQQQQQDEDDGLAPMLTEALVDLLHRSLHSQQPILITTNTQQPISGWGGSGSPSSWLDPIPIRPTNQDLTQNTTVSVLPIDTDNNCSVCQDTLLQGATVRKINHCGHIFHRSCIDIWFQTNVHCPTCRHDIRRRSTSLSNSSTNTP